MAIGTRRGPRQLLLTAAIFRRTRGAYRSRQALPARDNHWSEHVTCLEGGSLLTRRGRSSRLQAPAAEAQDSDFEALTLMHASALYRTAHYLTGNAFEAEDLTQETYLRAYRAFAGFRGENARAWLFAIMRHAFIDECRRRGRLTTVELDDGEGEVSVQLEGNDWAPSAETEALRRLPSEAIERAFAALPPEWRLIVLLADIEDFAYREIADVTGIPIGTVMSRLHRARKRLQEALPESARPGWKSRERSA
jgi:RNA polymerase sigma-70 factor (ECF subfamily)